ncbi:MAG: aspartate--tRNA(Asn) ligase [Candidatus Aenigmarchaeota archaeon]|nr:aspartate--tRNA(Asn) ligase [Candidatus Aenigmarchaeota archaeon]MCK5321783.1 aspartate--tRNA(Asn) ligase [Candidatus Aenigmarchaeota archaeon]
MPIRNEYSNEIKAGKKVKVVGWVHDIRDLGKLIFTILRDKEGQMQITAKKNETDEDIFNTIKKLNKEDLIKIEGICEKNERAPGGVEIKPQKIEIIEKSASPLPIELTGKIDSNIDRRFDWRFLDMRIKKNMDIFLLQNMITDQFHTFMQENKFTRIFSSRINGAATEGGTEYFPIMYFNKEAFLAQSPQLAKESVLASGLDRVYDIGFVYRAEPHHTTRHLCEYVSLDFEMVTDDMEEVMQMEEEFLKYCLKNLNKKAKHILDEYETTISIPKKIPRITLKEANKILKDMKVETDENDLTPDGEKAICKYVKKKYDEDFVYITEFPYKKKPFYIMKKEGSGPCHSFDLLYRGLEITSGGQREHRYDERVKNIKEKGIDPTTFDHMRFFKYGMPPHGGMGFGLERFTQMILNLKNVREATLMPRDPDRLIP